MEGLFAKLMGQLEAERKRKEEELQRSIQPLRKKAADRVLTKYNTGVISKDQYRRDLGNAIGSTPISKPQIASNPFKHAYNGAKPEFAGFQRSIAGLGESGTGLYDLVTPGEGTNRFTKNFTNAGQLLDIEAKDNNYGARYKAGQFAGEVAQIVATAGLAKAITTAPKVVQLASKIPQASNALKGSGLASKTGRFLLDPSVASNVVSNVAQGSGLRTARGVKNTPGAVALDAGISLAIPASLPITVAGAKKAINLSKPVVNNASDAIAKTTNPSRNALINTRKTAQKAYDVETNPKNKKEIARYLSDLDEDIRRTGNIIPTARADDGFRVKAPELGNTNPLESLKQEARKFGSAEEFVANNFEGAKKLNTDYQNRLLQSKEVTKNFAKSLDQARKQLDSPSDPYHFELNGQRATITKLQDLRRVGGDIMADVQMNYGSKVENVRLFNDQLLQLKPLGNIRQSKSPTGMIDNFVQDPNMERLFKSIPDELKEGGIYPGQLKDSGRINKLVTERQLDENINKANNENLARQPRRLGNDANSNISSNTGGSNNTIRLDSGNQSNTKLTDLYNQSQPSPPVQKIPTAQESLQGNSTTVVAPSKPKTTVRASETEGIPDGLMQTQALPLVPPNKPPVANAEQLALGTGKQNKSRYADKTVPNSQYVSQPIKDATKDGAPLYTPQTERAGAVDAASRLQQQGDDVFEGNVRASLDKPEGTITRQEAIDAQLYAQKLEEKIDPVNIDRASDIYDKLSAHYTKAGQMIQAASMMARRSPAGMKSLAQRKLTKAGVTITKQIQDEIDTAVARLAKTELDTDARALALDDMMHLIAKNTPTDKADLAINFWRANLLTAPTTTGGGAIGNIDNLLTRKLFVNPVATMVDMVQSIFTGKRTQTLATTGSLIKGAKEGVQNATSKRYWKTGYDPMDALEKVGKYDNPTDLNYGKSKAGRAVGTWVNGVYRVMGAVDQPYRYGAKAEVLSSLAKAEAINKGMKGSQRTQYIKEFMANPPAEAVNRAIKEGRFAVFQDETALGKVGSFVSNGFKQKGWNGAAAIVDFIVPFAKIPGSVATRLIKRTPIGSAQEIAKQIVSVRKGEPYDQRAMSQALAEGMAGAPIIGAGYALAQAGQITGGFPSDDKERKLWQAEGKQPNSIRVGDRWYSLNYIQPFGALLNIGAGAHQADKDGKDGMELVWAGLGEGGKSISDMSFLQGVSGAIDAIKTPERAAERFVANTASSLVPNIVRSFAGASDDFERQASGIIEGLQSGIPGLRQMLPTKTDAFGQPVPTKDNFLNRYVNPLKPSKVRGDETVAELRRMQDSELGTMPTESNKKVFGEGNELDKKQLNDLNASMARTVSEQWKKTIETPEYKNLIDGDKKKTLDAIKRDYGLVAKTSWAYDNGYGADFKPDLTSKQKSIAKGNNPDYLNYTESSDNETYKEKYETALTDYNDTTKGWSPVEKAKKEKELRKLTVQKDYDNDTVSLYGMAKADMYDFVKSAENGKELEQKLIAYDNAIYEAGLSEYRKYSNGIAPASGRRASGKGKGKGGKGKKPVMFSFPDIGLLDSTKSAKFTVKAPSVKKATMQRGRFAKKA